MRQWELVGITDREPVWFPASTGDREEHRVRWQFFWSTDTDLRFRTVSDAAAAALGQPAWRCEGQDLLATFGIEGANLAVPKRTPMRSRAVRRPSRWNVTVVRSGAGWSPPTRPTGA